MIKQPQINVTSIGPIGILWVAFIVMKVMEVVHWSWWIVIFWPVGLWLAGLGLILLAGAIGLTIGHFLYGSKAKA